MIVTVISVFIEYYVNNCKSEDSIFSILTEKMILLNKTANNFGVIRILASHNSTGIRDSVVKFHHELWWHFATRQIVALATNTENLQC